MSNKNKLMKLLLVVMTAVILLSLTFGILGCAAPAPAPGEKIKLLWASFTPPNDPYTEGIKAFADELNKRSGGRVEIELSLGGALAPAPQLYDKLVAGACDMVFFMPYAITGVFPYSEILALPCVLPKAEAATKSVYSLFKKGYTDKAWDKVKLLWASTGSGAVLYWRDKPATTIAEFANRKVRTFSTPQANVMTALGAVPVSMPVGECYGALEKGTVDGMWAGYFSCIPFKWYEVAKYCTEMRMFAGLNCTAMNLDSYNRLPKDIQKIIDDMSYPNDKYWMETAKRVDAAEAEGKKKFAEVGKIDPLAPGEIDKMEPLVAPIWTKWIADMEAKGLKPKEVLAEFYSGLKAAGVEKPFIGYKP